MAGENRSELQQMQLDAIRRVREMQQRAQRRTGQNVRFSPPTPGTPPAPESSPAPGTPPTPGTPPAPEPPREPEPMPCAPEEAEACAGQAAADTGEPCFDAEPECGCNQTKRREKANSSAGRSGGLLRFLGIGRDQALILALIMLLSTEGRNNELIVALLYVLV